jgi:hypothetical protein
MEEENGANVEYFPKVYSSNEASRALKFLPIVVV